MNNQTQCKVCLTNDLDKFLDFGNHPISHHYKSPEDKHSPNSNFQLVLCQCTNCGTIQLEKTADVSCFSVRFPWVRQNEPEAHLDSIVQKVISLPDIDTNSLVWGLSYKDESTVERFRKLGFTNCQTMDYATRFDSKDQIYNIAIIQNIISESRIEELQKTFGIPKIVICRHLLEHAHNTNDFFTAIKKLVSNGSYVVLEIPECSRLIKNLDYTMLWEEHITYFTEIIFKAAVNMYPMKILYSQVYKYPYEDCLILIVADSKEKDRSFEMKERINESMRAFNKYANSFQSVKDKIQSICNRMKSKNQKLAVYGSGHIASTFINTFELSDQIEFVIDDDRNKEGLVMPGSGLPIYSSDKIISEKIDVCFTAMSYANEQKVREKNQEFISNGGQLVPISPNASYSFYDMI